MRFSTSLILFTAIVTGSFHAVTVSAMPQGRRELPLSEPDNSAGGLSAGKGITTRGLEADSYGELHLPVNDRSNAAGQQHQTRRFEEVYARNDVPAAVLRARSGKESSIGKLVAQAEKLAVPSNGKADKTLKRVRFASPGHGGPPAQPDDAKPESKPAPSPNKTS
ncbi:hypothetical protein BC835DRAFT_1421092 [Cytidiella melzeri]|nr:hypothetical protein BC835DRAFT_1421092 [Cytidiella melzeri]